MYYYEKNPDIAVGVRQTLYDKIFAVLKEIDLNDSEADMLTSDVIKIIVTYKTGKEESMRRFRANG